MVSAMPSLARSPSPPSDLERMVAAVPDTAAAALQRKAYYFVPLTVNQGEDTVIADRYDVGAQRQRGLPSQSRTGRFAVRVYFDAADGRQVFGGV